MTTYNPAEVERLVRRTRKDYAATGSVWHADSLAMADQLEAARARIAEQDRDLADARRDVMLQAARLAALESELATLQASVINALSSAGPEATEDERTT